MTAVSWLEQILRQNCGAEFIQLNEQIFDKAKEMEKEQLKEAQVAFVSDTFNYRTVLLNQFENWYNEKYKK